VSTLRGRLRASSYSGPIFAIVVLLICVNVVVQPSFASQGNWAPLADGAAVVMVMSMAQAVAVISGRGGLDLSVGPLAGLVNGVVVMDIGAHRSAALVIAVALGIGVASGLLNGILIAVVRLPAVVVTLGTYIIYQGLTLEVVPTSGGSAPGWLSRLSGDEIGIPGMWVFVLAGFVVWGTLMATAFRRNLFGMGSDERAAYTVGVPIVATRVLAYCVTGVIAAIGGLAITALLGSADPSVAPLYTLESIAAVALGGIALTGGRGGVLGAALGGAALFLIENLLSVANVNVDLIDGAYGVILLAAVAFNSLALGKRDGARAAFRRLRQRVEMRSVVLAAEQSDLSGKTKHGRPRQ
jgi:ribose transport system permease protein